MKSKIKTILEVKEFESSYGKLFYYKLELEDGYIGGTEKGKKSDKAYNIGDEIEYEATTNDKGYAKIKVIEPEKPLFGGGKTPQQRNYKADFVGFAMSYTKDLLVAGKIADIDQMDTTFDKVFKKMCDAYDSLSSK